MRASKVVATCIYNELQAVGLYLALDGASMHTDPFTSGKKYCKLVNNAIFIVMKAYSLFQQWLPVHSNYSTCRSCYAAYALGAIKYRLSNMGCHVGLWGILWVSRRGI